MPADRTLLALAVGLLLCCHLCPRSEAQPPRPKTNIQLTSPPPTPTPTPTPTPSQPLVFDPNSSTGPIVQSIFTVPQVCPVGLKLTGDPPRCHKLV